MTRQPRCNGAIELITLFRKGLVSAKPCVDIASCTCTPYVCCGYKQSLGSFTTWLLDSGTVINSVNSHLAGQFGTGEIDKDPKSGLLFEVVISTHLYQSKRHRLWDRFWVAHRSFADPQSTVVELKEQEVAGPPVGSREEYEGSQGAGSRLPQDSSFLTSYNLRSDHMTTTSESSRFLVVNYSSLSLVTIIMSTLAKTIQVWWRNLSENDTHIVFYFCTIEALYFSCKRISSSSFYPFHLVFWWLSDASSLAHDPGVGAWRNRHELRRDGKPATI